MEGIIRKAAIAAKAVDDKKARDIAVLDLRGICTFADAFLICTGSTNLQLKALVESVREALKAEGHAPPTVDGDRQSAWIVMDYGDLIVHLMNEESRGYYRLEDLWGDGAPIEWEGAAAGASARAQ